MGICHSQPKQKTSKGEDNTLGCQNPPAIATSRNSMSKIIIDKNKSQQQKLYLEIKKDKNQNGQKSPTASKTPQIITQIKQHIFDFQSGFFKKYSALKNQKSEQVLIYQHNITGQLARVTLLQIDQMDDLNFFQKLKFYNQKCQNICQIIETYKEKNLIYLVQEYCKGGTLSTLIKQKPLNYQQATLIIQQIIIAVNYIHNQNLTHCHLTIDSFSISDQKNLYVKLSDINPIFQSNYLNTIEDKWLKEEILRYQSPEQGNNSARDVWSIGIIFYQLLTGQILEIEKQSNKHVIMNLDNKLENIENEAKEILFKMLDVNPESRITLKQIQEQCYFFQAINSNSLQQCIENLANVKQMTYFQSIILYFMMVTFHTEEVQILTQLFDEADKDADNQLNKIELTNLYKVIIPEDQDFINEQIDRIFLYMDVDQSGKISLNEFITAAANKSDLLNDDYLQSCFKQLQNQKGGISAKSLKRKIEIDEQLVNQEIKEVTYDYIYYPQFKEIMSALL
ncbi:unnamed protein product [Paramecium sonneborni]|uniref:Calcium-dependent protein kinase n=1 Tax=Paramecium sonneborni TaxID=65129 RepID=A0A8S1MY69_9CILI|nr:unnamed protein product [Paramecium sonneborni]